MTFRHDRTTVTRRARRVPTLIAVTVLCLAVSSCGNEDDTGSSSTTGPTTSEPRADTSDTSGTTADAGDAVEPGRTVWPPEGATPYDDPVDAATDAAVELVGFVDPVVGEFLEGDGESGEVEVRAVEGGPPTTVLVRQLDGESWSVLGLVSEQIVPEQPESGATVTDPVSVQGTGTAFEGTIQVAVRDEAAAPVGSGVVTGGGNGEMGPFSGEIPIDVGDARGGSIAFYELSAEDGGGVLAATVLPVRFGG
jgi:hypothetical protein